MRYHVTIGDETHEVVIEGDRIEVDGEPVDAELQTPDGSGALRLRVGDSTHRLLEETASSGFRTFHLGGRRIVADVLDERTGAIRAMAGATGAGQRVATIRAPMPGLVVKVEAEVGDLVVSGQGVVIVEAMKMENELTAEADARIADILVSPGDAVEKGQVLVELEPSEQG